MSNKNNTGADNSGDRNSGYWNSGNRNSGDRNSGYWNSGDLNTTEPKLRIFNKETDVSREDVEYPNYFYFDLTEWVREEAMTKEEKEENPGYETIGGYLKTLGYHEAWRQSWDKASDEDRRKTLELPNWDNELFLEISGIDVEKELNAPKRETVEFNGKKYDKEEFEKRLEELESID